MAKRVRRTKAQIEADRSKGLGDTIEKITEATGLKRVAKALFGEDCGCDDRKVSLNRMFPYRKNQCLTEDEYNTLKELITDTKIQYTPSDQFTIIPIYNRVFGLNQQPTTCSSCWVDIINDLKKLITVYEDTI